MTTPTEPTPEQKWIEVLEWAGWTNIHFGYSHPDFAGNDRQMKEWVGIHPINKEHDPKISLWPIPPMSLDAVHQMESKFVENAEMESYMRYLKNIVAPNADWENWSTYWTLIHATAPQRIDALWRTVKE